MMKENRKYFAGVRLKANWKMNIMSHNAWPLKKHSGKMTVYIANSPHVRQQNRIVELAATWFMATKLKKTHFHIYIIVFQTKEHVPIILFYFGPSNDSESIDRSYCEGDI